MDSDTLKLYNKAQGTKTMNLVINFDDDERLIFEEGSRTLTGYGCGIISNCLHACAETKNLF